MKALEKDARLKDLVDALRTNEVCQLEDRVRTLERRAKLYKRERDEARRELKQFAAFRAAAQEFAEQWGEHLTR